MLTRLNLPQSLETFTNKYHFLSFILNPGKHQHVQIPARQLVIYQVAKFQRMIKLLHISFNMHKTQYSSLFQRLEIILLLWIAIGWWFFCLYVSRQVYWRSCPTGPGDIIIASYDQEVWAFYTADQRRLRNFYSNCSSQTTDCFFPQSKYCLMILLEQSYCVQWENSRLCCLIPVFQHFSQKCIISVKTNCEKNASCLDAQS